MSHGHGYPGGAPPGQAGYSGQAPPGSGGHPQHHHHHHHQAHGHVDRPPTAAEAHAMGQMMGAFGNFAAGVMSGTATPGSAAMAGGHMMGAAMGAAPPGAYSQPGHGHAPPGAYSQPPYNPSAPPGGAMGHGGAPPNVSVSINMTPPGSHGHGGFPPGGHAQAHVGGAAPPNSGGYSHSASPHALDDHSFGRFLASVQQATFASDKHNALSVGLAHGSTRLTCSQVTQLVRAFPHDSDQIQAAVAAYPCVVDPAHWGETLNQAFKFSSSRDKVLQQTRSLGCHGHNMGGHGAPPGGHSHGGAPPGQYGHGAPGGHARAHVGGAAPPSSSGSSGDFNRFLQSIQQASFSSDKHNALSVGLGGGIRVNCNQATQVIQAFPHDSDKQKAAIAIYPAIVDKAHFAEVLNNGFSFSSSRDKVKRALHL